MLRGRATAVPQAAVPVSLLVELDHRVTATDLAALRTIHAMPMMRENGEALVHGRIVEVRAQARETHQVQLDVSRAEVIVDAVGRRITTAIKIKVAVLNLQMSSPLDDSGMHFVIDVVAEATK